MAYQFIHIEKYAKKVAKLKKGDTKKWTASEIAKEAMRVDGNCSHVKNPQAPKIIYGDDPLTIVEAAEAHLDLAKDAAGQKARQDTTILISGVASFPTATADLNTPENQEAYIKWRDLTLAFLKSEYGEHLKGVVEHTDEAFPHLHFYAFNQSDIIKTKKLYAGDTEKGEALSEGKKRLGAYQDRYFEQVSAKCGLLRTGPKRKRLGREDYKKEQQIAHKVAWVYDQIDHEYIQARAAHEEADRRLEAALAKMGDAEKEIREAVINKTKMLVNAKADYDKSIDYAKKHGFAERQEMKTTSSTKAVTDIAIETLSRLENGPLTPKTQKPH